MYKSIRVIFAGVALAAFAFVPSSVLASAYADIWGTSATNELEGSRSSLPDGGIYGTGSWGAYDSDSGASGFVLSWDISQDAQSGMWTYVYTANTSGSPRRSKDISHFILEVTNDDTSFYFDESLTSQPVGDGDPQMYEEGPGNPDMPAGVFGVKFDFGSEEGEGFEVTYTIVTDRAPVYGVFYAKDGKDAGTQLVAWANALDPNSTDYLNNTLTYTDFVVRPDGSPVPVPAAVWMLGSGLVGLISLKRRKS